MSLSHVSPALPLLGTTPRRPEPVIGPLSDAISRAALASGLSTKALYDALEMDKAQWSRSLSSGNVPLGKLLMLASFPAGSPESQFWAAFRPELDALIGDTPKSKAAIVREALSAVSQLVIAFTCADDESRRMA